MLSAPSESSSPRSGERVGANLDANELLDRLPLSNDGDSERHESYLRARELAIESREADLAEWEQSLAAMESDIRNREAILEWRIEDEGCRRERDQGNATGTSSDRTDEQLDRKVEHMNDLLKELKASQTENLAQRRELDQLEDSLSEATSDVVSAQVTVSAQQDELEMQRTQVRNELDQLQADRQAFDSDRQQVQELLEALREERAALQRERERYLLECGPAPLVPADRSDAEPRVETAEETAASVQARAESLSETISTELGQDSDRFNRLFAAPRETPPAPAAPTPAALTPAEYELHDCDENSIAEYMDRLLNRARRGRSDEIAPAPVRPSRPAPSAPVTVAPVAAPAAPVSESSAATVVDEPVVAPRPRARPRQSAEEIREGIHHLRQIANLSANEALSRYFWKRHRPAFTLKVALVILSFSLAALLYMNHGIAMSSLSAVAWAAAAIGLITACNLVHTLTELSRLNARFQQEAFKRMPEEPSSVS